MKFSVILPIYNVEKYLKECIKSVLKQTYTDYEIILVDDGSKDGSPAICDEYASAYDQIRVIHKVNGGLSDARNVGTDLAQGQYVIYIDSDDFIIDEHFLEKVAAKTESNPDVVFYKYQKYYDQTGVMDICKYSYDVPMQKKSFPERIMAMVKADAFYGMAWIKAIKREVMEKNHIRFEVGLLGEDMEWNYHVIFNSNSIEFIDEAFIAYRQREGSITATHKIKNLTDFIYVLEKWSERITKECQERNLKIALYGSLAKYYSNLLVVYARLRDTKKKECVKRIKKLSWLLDYSMSSRPLLVKRIYKLFGFNLTIFALNALDKVRR